MKKTTRFRSKCGCVVDYAWDTEFPQIVEFAGFREQCDEHRDPKAEDYFRNLYKRKKR